MDIIQNLVCIAIFRKGVPNTHCGDSGGEPITNIESTPVIGEKPYIVYNNGKYSLFVPSIKYNSIGITNDYNDGKTIDFSNVYVANENDTSSIINYQLNNGNHLILCGGNYNLDSSIIITKSNTIVLGIGFPVLISSNGNPVITINSGIYGVKIAGLLLQAGKINSKTLLRWGDYNKIDNGNPLNPGFLYDIFARVGGTNDPN